uniref:Uncharacterized protein n=1 Tax=Yamagishiella unicocca TaxID=51707 RepID=A0A1W6R6N7_9CHLO|nr:hypothetical protein [Yamagishiella unicocca]
MAPRRSFNGLAWLCGAQHQRDWQQQAQQDQLDQQQQQNQHRLQLHKHKLRSELDSPTPPSKTALRDSAGSSSNTPGSGAAPSKGDGIPRSAFASGNRTLSFQEDTDSLSSVPVSEAVFGLATRASAPAAVLSGLKAHDGRAVAPAVATDVEPPRGNCILKPMASGACTGTARSSIRRRLSPSKSMPAHLFRHAGARAAGAAGAAGLAASASPLMSCGPAAGPATLKRAPSLSVSERSYGSSLLSAAFDRHETRRGFTMDSTNTDSASSVSGGSCPGRAARGARASGGVGFGGSSSLASMTPSASSSASTSSGNAASGDAKTAAAAAAAVAVAPVDAEAAALAAAREFCDAFLRALASGDARWGSDPRVASLFGEGSRMLTHDGQLFVGRTAIIRRLNAGMEQLHKMLGAMPAGGDEAAAASQAQQLADKFRFGLRRFRLQDQFAIRGGSVARLKRTRG